MPETDRRNVRPHASKQGRYRVILYSWYEEKRRPNYHGNRHYGNEEHQKKKVMKKFNITQNETETPLPILIHHKSRLRQHKS